MKKLIYILPVLGLLMMMSCHEEMDGLVTDSATSMKISIGNLSTRTWLDSSAEGDVLPVYWSDGDVINVNGVSSEPLSIAEGEKLSEAEFNILGASAPYRVIYPHSICGDNVYDNDTTILIDLPAVQEYSPVSFGNDAAVLYGYGESENLELRNLSGALRVNIVDQADEPTDDVICRAELVSNGADSPISGKFRLNPSSGKLTAEDGRNEISLEINVPVRLDKTIESSFYFVVPAGEYKDGFTIKLYNEENQLMNCRWLKSSETDPGVTVVPGVLVDFNRKEFVRGATEIISAEQWNDFANMYNAGDQRWKSRYMQDDGSVVIGSDFTLGDGAVMLDHFSGILDGKGATITNPKASMPLVKTLTGTIRNLTLAGRMSESENPRTVGLAPFVSVLDGGAVESCINRMELDFTPDQTKGIAFSGFVMKATGGRIAGCVNEATISVFPDCLTGSSSVHGGGFVAIVDGMKSELVVDNCVNNGDIRILVANGEYTTSKGAKAYSGLTNAGFGGIVGYVADSQSGVILKNCSNTGNISLDLTYNTNAAATQYSLGGIVGAGAVMNTSMILADPRLPEYDGHKGISIINCKNIATISNGSASSSNNILCKTYAGGIAGSMIGVKDAAAIVSECSNEGSVIYTGSYRNAGRAAICGGLVGLGGFIDINKCLVKAEIGSDKKMCYAVAGVIGAVLTTFSISDTKVFAENLLMIQADPTAESVKKYRNIGNYGLAVTCFSTDGEMGYDSDLTGSVIKNSAFGGKISLWESVAMSATPDPINENKIELSAADFSAYLLSSTYKGIDIKIEADNSYWDGN